MSGIKTILVVEDEPGLAEVLRLNLEAAGLRVVAATDGLQGYDLFRTEHPDLVTLDLRLPTMSGFRLIRLIKQEKTVSVPVVVVSALDYAEAEEALRAGADDFITKPFDPTALVDRIAYHLQAIADQRPATVDPPRCMKRAPRQLT